MVLPGEKIVASLAELSSVCEKCKLEGETIVLTSGCFDILHPGHLEHLVQAAHMGSLVVGINSDQFVKKMKGQFRPLQNERNRAILMAGFYPVRFVAIFDDDYDLIRAARPDIYTLSVTSYTRVNEDPKRVRLLKEIGSRIVELGGEKIDSTTKIIERAAFSFRGREIGSLMG